MFYDRKNQLFNCLCLEKIYEESYNATYTPVENYQMNNYDEKHKL